MVLTEAKNVFLDMLLLLTALFVHSTLKQMVSLFAAMPMLSITPTLENHHQELLFLRLLSSADIVVLQLIVAITQSELFLYAMWRGVVWVSSLVATEYRQNFLFCLN